MSKKKFFSVAEQTPSNAFGIAKDHNRNIQIDLAKVKENPNQPRKYFDEDELLSLSGSIENFGQLTPIIVRPNPEFEGSYIIVAGERRVRALRMLKRDSVQAFKISDSPEEISLVENVQRKDLLPMEEADYLHFLINQHGYTQEEVGKITGKNQTKVARLLSLRKLPQKIREEYHEAQENISISILYELSTIKDSAKILDLWERVKRDGIGVSDIRSQKKIKMKKKPLTKLEKTIKSAGNFKKEIFSLEKINDISIDELHLLKSTIDDINEKIIFIINDLEKH